MTYLKPETYSGPSQRFKMEFLGKETIVTIVKIIFKKNYNYLTTALHLRSLTGF